MTALNGVRLCDMRLLSPGLRSRIEHRAWNCLCTFKHIWNRVAFFLVKYVWKHIQVVGQSGGGELIRTERLH
jgi:hypothetical protein